MRRNYRFLLRPTCRQQQALNDQLRIHAELYNAALEERRNAYRHSRKNITYVDQCRQLTLIRQERPDVGALNAHSCQQTLRKLDRAFAAFFRRVKAGEKAGYPRFKPERRVTSIVFPSVPDDAQVDFGQGRISVRGARNLRVHLHRQLPAEANIKTLTIKREGQKWYAILSCDDVREQPLPATGREVGIDLGIASLLTTSDGEHISNSRHGASTSQKLADAHRALARCQPGSNRRLKAIQRISRTLGKARDQRRDDANKIALDLVRRYDVIAHERLEIENMSKSARGTLETPGRNVAQKAGLNRTILDAGWGVVLRMLRDKAESAGREVIAVDARNTSRRCATCGYIAKENRVSQALFVCVACGHRAHAEVNAAINIRRAGLALRERREATREADDPSRSHYTPILTSDEDEAVA